MIALKLIVQSLVAASAISTSIGAVVILSKKTTDTFLLVYAYVPTKTDLVYANDQTKTDNKTTKELWEAESSNTKELTKKNYECVFKQTKDTNCEIYKLPFAAESKTVDFQSIKNSIKNTAALSKDVSKKPVKTDLKYRSFFLLKVSSDIASQAFLDKENLLVLSSKTEKNKYFTNLIAVHDISNSSSKEAKTRFAISKVVEETSTAEIKSAETYHCEFEAQQKPNNKKCALILLPNYPSSKDIKDVDNPTTKPQITIANNNYFLIEFIFQTYTPQDLFEKTVVITGSNATQNTNPQTFKLKMESTIFVNLSLGSTIGETIILN